MEIKTYNKLVRDNIPQIIQEDGKVGKFIQLQEHVMLSNLVTKLNEEFCELLQAINDGFNSDDILAELADMATVIDGIIPHVGSYSRFQEIKATKDRTHGQYFKNMFLVSVSERSELCDAN